MYTLITEILNNLGSNIQTEIEIR